MTDMVKVWALAPGLRGFDANGNPITLQPGTGRWMGREQALVAEEQGKVQIMVGLDTSQLRDPRSYKTAAVAPEDTETAVANASPKRRTKTRTASAGTGNKRTYRRRDMTAEPPGA
jgi:hypothetical protein